MADLVPYVPSYSFTGWQAAKPTKPLPAPAADNEFANIELSIGSLVSGLDDVRRADGALRNGVVTVDSLADEVKVPWTGGAIAAWATPVNYAAGIAAHTAAPTTAVYYDGSTYLCVKDHTTTGIFDGAKWRIIAAKGTSGSGSGDMLAANNLSDLVDAAQARTNLHVLGLAGGTLTGALTLADGVVGTPGVRFASSTGFYRVGTAGLGVSIAGARKLAVLDDGSLRGATDATLLWGRLGASADVQTILTAANQGAARTALGLGGLATKDAVAGGDITDLTVGTADIANGAVTAAKLANGVPVQTVIATLATVTTTASIIPFDDTIPQNTEGLEIIQATITPKFATSTLLIEAEFTGTVNGGVVVSAAVFQDSTADALFAAGQFMATGETGVLRFSRTLAAGTVNATTFKLRVGQTSGLVTLTINGINGARRYGGVLVSSLRITEIKG